MNKVEIFDPAMCCSTGVCGPGVDPDLTRVASAVYSLKRKGADIQRYNLANEPSAFSRNEKVNQLLHDKGVAALPITLLNDEVVKVGKYPTNDEFADWCAVKMDELTQKPGTPISINLN
ncbi:UNVERIFIED_CONTAM: arsenite efflux transporter metallochaperone ArsD [Halobacillus marinus]|uniref:arsenite efflux transporter metallochaperone ArsD n=1 Tax=Bacillaceae TaxID=186817 RepID=UPI0002A5066C|nr:MULTISPECIES: arsenite efflux transporter metallochaperone ArsD [Bacillaceae]ELK48477.1 arsenical resistance operon repressor ArsD [Halobacillus sp. BAB-2008]QHT47858.1 arsenite efflux transporter metallochaperone ArsD [Bacillus sp. SB49]